MGDLEKKAEARKLREKNTEKKRNGFDFFNKDHGKGNKDKAISLRVNSDSYETFKRICRAKGITANACLNMLMNEYTLDNKRFIE